MDADRLARVERLFHAVQHLPPDERAKFLDEASGGDAEIRAEVQALLDTPASAAGFMAKPAAAQFEAIVDLTGRSLGVYVIGERIGAGGMGEVYQARDTKLGREVAVKVLPAVFAGNPERLARFQREARVLASLNHPNIAQIHGLEEGDGITALVMELVPGPTLADRIAQGPIPIKEALPIARQIVDAVEAAHEQGIIHRDLKPANVKVREDGTVKVLDFGLAKAMSPEGADATGDHSQSPTITTPATLQGTILGTAAYMAPEQAKGRAVDKRADIWAFGCVLYEMLTGRRAFEGDDVSEVFAGIIKSDPDWTRLPAGTPATVRMLIRTCLQKDARRRVRDIGDVRLALEGTFEANAERSTAASGTDRRMVWAWALAAALLGALAAAVVGRVAGAGAEGTLPPLPLHRLSVIVPSPLTLPTGSDTVMAVSPDGQTLVFRAVDQDGVIRLYRRDLGGRAAVPIPGAENVDDQPIFAPDGQSIVFRSGATLVRVALAGGRLRTIELPAEIESMRGASWGPDGTLLVGTRRGLLGVPPGGGDTDLIVPSADGREYWYPQWLPGGQAVLFSASFPSGGGGDLVVFDTATNDTKTVLPDAVAGLYVPTGHLVFVRRRSLWAIRFDLDELEVRGDEILVEEGIGVEGGGAVQFAAAGGTLAYRGVGVLPSRLLVWVDRADGNERVVDLPAQAYTAARIYPGDGRVAFGVNDGAGIDIFVMQPNGNTDGLARDPGLNTNFAWAPAGTEHAGQVAYRATGHEGGPGMFLRSADGTGEVRRLTAGNHSPYSWSPDGKQVWFTYQGDVGMVGVDREPTIEMVLTSSDFEGVPAISPDGRWLAYTSDDLGQPEVFVRAVSGGPRTVISSGGGAFPVWASDGTELFYEVNGTIVAVTANEDDPSTWGPATTVVDGPYVSVNGRAWDVAPDGQRFLVLKDVATDEDAAAAPDEIIVVTNSFEELNRLLPLEE